MSESRVSNLHTVWLETRLLASHFMPPNRKEKKTKSLPINYYEIARNEFWSEGWAKYDSIFLCWLHFFFFIVSVTLSKRMRLAIMKWEKKSKKKIYSDKNSIANKLENLCQQKKNKIRERKVSLCLAIYNNEVMTQCCILVTFLFAWSRV